MGQFDYPNLNATNDSVTVLTTTTVVSAADPKRASEIITNDSTSDMYVAFGAAAVLNKGVYLAPGQSLTYGFQSAIPWLGAVNAIAKTSSGNLTRQICDRVQGR